MELITKRKGSKKTLSSVTSGGVADQRFLFADVSNIDTG
jgi:hypothetical protein